MSEPGKSARGKRVLPADPLKNEKGGEAQGSTATSLHFLCDEYLTERPSLTYAAPPPPMHTERGRNNRKSGRKMPRPAPPPLVVTVTKRVNGRDGDGDVLG